jgi:uncharacterized MnhB-related membrane protein
VVGRRLAVTAEHFIAFRALHSVDAHVDRSLIGNGITLFVFVPKVYSSLVNAEQVAAEALLNACVLISELFNFPVVEFLSLLLREELVVLPTGDLRFTEAALGDPVLFELFEDVFPETGVMRGVEAIRRLQMQHHLFFPYLVCAY